MEALFLKIVNMSLTAGWMIFAVFLLRLIFCRAPKWIFCLLWGLVAVRLICPFTLESTLSLIPSSQPLPEDMIYTAQPQVDSGIESIDRIVNPILHDTLASDGMTSANPTQIWSFVVSQLWLLGMVLMMLYAVCSCLWLMWRMKTATLYQKNAEMAASHGRRIVIKQSEYVDSPFVLGFIRPVIYLPYHLEESDLKHVISHETAHIRRKDHWWKPIGFLLLSIHWFNPLIWIAYIFLCRDIEAACDEKVIKEMEKEERKGYSTALLHCSVHRRSIMVCPLAFGEVGVKDRIKHVMNYKRPAFWVIIIAVLASVFVAVVLLTDPALHSSEVMGAEYKVKKVLYQTSAQSELEFGTSSFCSITANHHLILCPAAEDGKLHYDNLVYAGKMEPYELTGQELKSYMYEESQRKNVNVGNITDAYIVREKNNSFYFVFQTKNGNIYLAHGWEDVSERGQAGADDTMVDRLYLLENSLKGDAAPMGLFNLTLTLESGHNIEAFEYKVSDEFPGYAIVGFMADGAPYSMADIGFAGYHHYYMSDMGYAVFKVSADDRYKLLDYHIYENAAVENDGIYYCEHPAIMNEDGELRAKETFDVILSCNNQLAEIQRVYTYEDRDGQGEPEKELHSVQIDNPCSLILFGWDLEKDTDKAVTISQTFIGKGGYQIGNMAWKDEDSPYSIGKQLTLQDVIALSEKGMDLSWEDFDDYAYYVTGSGLYIRVYEIDDEYSLMIGGSYPFDQETEEKIYVEEPMYIYLCSESAEMGQIDIRKDKVESFIQKLEENPLDKAVRAAVLSNNMHSTYEPDQCFHAADFLLLGKKEVSGTALEGSRDYVTRMTLYGLALYQVYEIDEYNYTIQSVSGNYCPVVITLEAEYDSYTLTDYWEPRDGKFLEQDVRDKYPDKWAEEALDSQKYIQTQMQNCLNQVQKKYNGYQYME